MDIWPITRKEQKLNFFHNYFINLCSKGTGLLKCRIITEHNFINAWEKALNLPILGRGLGRTHSERAERQYNVLASSESTVALANNKVTFLNLSLKAPRSLLFLIHKQFQFLLLICFHSKSQRPLRLTRCVVKKVVAYTSQTSLFSLTGILDSEKHVWTLSHFNSSQIKTAHLTLSTIILHIHNIYSTEQLLLIP